MRVVPSYVPSYLQNTLLAAMEVLLPGKATSSYRAALLLSIALKVSPDGRGVVPEG